MIEKHLIFGSKSTTYFDFKYTFHDGVFSISTGKYYRNNELIYELSEPFECEIEEGKYYNFVLTTNGIVVVHEWTDEPIEGLIDVLAWGNSEKIEVKAMVSNETD